MRHGISIRLLALIGAVACSDTGSQPLPQPYDEPCSDGSCQFVAPDGTGAVDCTPETPCSFPDLLVAESAAGLPSHIWLLPGTYDLPAEPFLTVTFQSLLEGRDVVIRGNLYPLTAVFRGIRFEGSLVCGGETKITLQDVVLVGSLASGSPTESGGCTNVIERSTVIGGPLFAFFITSSLIINTEVRFIASVDRSTLIDTRVIFPFTTATVTGSILVGTAFLPPLPSPPLQAHHTLFAPSLPAGFTLASTSRVADPLFVDADAGDYHLSPTSPAIDAGDPTALTPDRTGAAPVGVIDIGAFEHVP